MSQFFTIDWGIFILYIDGNFIRMYKKMEHDELDFLYTVAPGIIISSGVIKYSIIISNTCAERIIAWHAYFAMYNVYTTLLKAHKYC